MHTMMSLNTVLIRPEQGHSLDHWSMGCKVWLLEWLLLKWIDEHFHWGIDCEWEPLLSAVVRHAASACAVSKCEQCLCTSPGESSIMLLIHPGRRVLSHVFQSFRNHTAHTPHIDPQLPTPCGGKDVFLSETVVAWGLAASTVDVPHIMDEAGFGCNLLPFSTYMWVKTKLFNYISKMSFSWDTDGAPAALPLFFKTPWKPWWSLINLNLSFSAVIIGEHSSICYANCLLSFFLHLTEVN